jgi:L-lactate utilization protein LutC
VVEAGTGHVSSRTDILERLRRGAATSDYVTLTEHSAEPAAQTVAGFARFAELAGATQMTTTRVAGQGAVPNAVRTYLAQQQLPPNVVTDPTLKLPIESWLVAGVGQVSGDVQADGDVYISAGLAAIAECGAVVIASGPGRALRNDFLARTHIVVVPEARLLPSFSGLWNLLRADGSAGRLAREYCLVTGPSRTADLGVPAKLGAHGPERVHIIFFGD